ncbi:MAG: DUF2155 domain-containing protein [Roseinatronobacter sp.]|jgi:hypothetical protein|nr:DUF2155 domain-containing protein [Roseinatronobacter sp.]
MRFLVPISLAAFGLVFALSASAQDIEVPTASDTIATGDGAVLRGLDRVAGTSADIALPLGGSAEVGHLRVMLQDCRYPVENPAAEAYAWIEIFDMRADDMIFSGWMIASSPALNALDHRRYDLWLLRCTTS